MDDDAFLAAFEAAAMPHVVATFPQLDRIEAVIACYGGFEDRRLPYRHWRAGTLDGPVARRRWVEPDLRVLP